MSTEQTNAYLTMVEARAIWAHLKHASAQAYLNFLHAERAYHDLLAADPTVVPGDDPELTDIPF